MKKIIWIISLFFLLTSSASAQSVYPGDVDNNGEVNHLDLLYIGIANGSIGPPRLLQGDLWQAYTFTNWGITLPNTGLDYAYADCNGDGVIDFSDRHIVEMNYGLTHGTPTPINFMEGLLGLNAEIYFDSIGFINPFFQNGFVVVSISLGRATFPATDFYGISFTIEFDPDIFCNGLCITDFSADLSPNFDPTGFSFYEIAKYKNNDPNSGELQITIVKNQQSAVDGFGQIGTYAGIIEDNVVDLFGSAGELLTPLKIKDIKFVDENFNESPIVSDSIEVQVIDPDTLLFSSVEDLELGINIFPNPVKDIFTVESLNNTILEIELMDLNGQMIYYNKNERSNSSIEKIELSLNEYPEGIYFVKLLTEKGNIVKKITVLRE